MFLVKHKHSGTSDFVFLHQDPRSDGYSGTEVEEVTLDDYDTLHLGKWLDGHDCPDEVAGQDPADPTHYKMFKYKHELRAAGFHVIPGRLCVCEIWSKYLMSLEAHGEVEK